MMDSNQVDSKQKLAQVSLKSRIINLRSNSSQIHKNQFKIQPDSLNWWIVKEKEELS